MAPSFLKEISFYFQRAIKEVVKPHDISDYLIINLDQALLSFMLLSKYAMDKKNEKLLPLAKSAVKSQEHFVLLSGIFLPIAVRNGATWDRFDPWTKILRKQNLEILNFEFCLTFKSVPG